MTPTRRSDLVVMPSTWEGFGNPVLESVTHRRPLALYPYPVAIEIVAYGFGFFGLDEVGAITTFLDVARRRTLRRQPHNRARTLQRRALPARLRDAARDYGNRVSAN